MLVNRLRPGRQHMLITNLYDADGYPVEIMVCVTDIERTRTKASVGVLCENKSVKIKRVDGYYDRNRPLGAD